jgi:hypothetical protein
MRKKALWTVSLALMLSAFLLHGCATPDVPNEKNLKYLTLKKRDLTSLTPLRVAIINFSGWNDRVRIISDGGRKAGQYAGAFGLTGQIVAGVAVMAREKSIGNDIVEADVPRYYELIMKQFCERASKEIPGWPSMVVEEQPVTYDFKKKFFKNQSGYLLLLETYPALHTSSKLGFESLNRAAIYESKKDVFWLKDFKYSSKDYRRNLGLEENRADNFKLLKEEVEFAAETTVSDFIQTILKEIGPPEVSAQTEREQRAVSPEKLSQEQTQPKEASKDYGIISITSDPPGAKIFIDGEFKGQTPAEISLSTGTYQLFLQHQLFEPYKDSVVLEKDQTKILNIRLSPEGRE